LKPLAALGIAFLTNLQFFVLLIASVLGRFGVSIWWTGADLLISPNILGAFNHPFVLIERYLNIIQFILVEVFSFPCNNRRCSLWTTCNTSFWYLGLEHCAVSIMYHFPVFLKNRYTDISRALC